MVQQIVGLVLVLVVAACILYIGGAIVDLTASKTVGVIAAAGGTSVTNVTTSMASDLKTSFTTLTSFLPVIVIAAVGGVALAYVMGVFRGGM